MIQWRKVSLLTLLFFLLAWSLFSVSNARDKESAKQTKQDSVQDSSKINNDQEQPFKEETGTSGQPRNISWILYLILILGFGATAGLTWFCFYKFKLLLRTEVEYLAERIKALKEPPPENPQSGKAASKNIENSNQPQESEAEQELGSLKAEISDLKAKLDEARRGLDPEDLSLKISGLIESSLAQNLQQFHATLDKLGPELKELIQQRNQNPVISPVKAVQGQDILRPEPPVQSSQADYSARINQDFQSWLQVDSLNQHFVKEYKQNGLTYLGIAPRRNTAPFQGLDPELKAYTNDDFYEIRTEPGMNAGHVKAIEKPAIIMIKDGIRETKQKGSYTQVKRG